MNIFHVSILNLIDFQVFFIFLKEYLKYIHIYSILFLRERGVHMCLGDNIRYLRNKRGFSQDFIAEKLGYKSYTTIQKWESGVSEPPIKKLKELALLLNADMNDMMNKDLSVEESNEIGKGNASTMLGFQDMLKYFRTKDGLSQIELAETLGIAPSTISMYEAGKREPDFETEEKIADFFNIDLDTLRGRSIENIEIGNRIKSARCIRDVTLDEIALKVGVAKSTIQRYEAGKIENPKIPVLHAIANALNVNPAWLIGKTNIMEPVEEKAPPIMNYYNMLNETGRREAEKRVEELTHLPKYTAKVVAEVPDHLVSIAAHNETELTDDELELMEQDITDIKGLE